MEPELERQMRYAADVLASGSPLNAYYALRLPVTNGRITEQELDACIDLAVRLGASLRHVADVRARLVRSVQVATGDQDGPGREQPSRADSEVTPPPTQPLATTPQILQGYHFTDRSNLPSIRRLGLLSARQLRFARYDHRPSSSTASRRIDEKLNLDDYVRLCLKPEHPMAEAALFRGSASELAWLEVNLTSLVRLRGRVRYTNTNAVSRSMTIDDDPATALNGDHQAEILVRGSVPKSLIREYRPTP